MVLLFIGYDLLTNLLTFVRVTSCMGARRQVRPLSETKAVANLIGPAKVNKFKRVQINSANG